MPLFAVVAMIGIGYILGLPGDGTASAKDIAQPWFYFFLIFGVLTTVIGIAAFFIIPKDDIAPNRDEPYFKNLIYGFRPSTIKKAPLFYIALLSFMFFNIATDAFMLVAGGVLILMSQSLFRAINPTSSPAPEKIDASPIVSSVFAFLGAALGLFGAYKAIKD